MSKSGLRYLVVGGSVYVFELAVIVAAQQIGASSVWAVAWSFILGTLLSFILQKFVTFGDKRTHHKVVLAQLVAVGLLVLFNFGFTLLVTRVLSPPLPAVVSRTLALAVTVIWNYYLYKTRIFKRSEENPVY
ncbi:MAG: hypothetical protein JWM37_690 [Candidatus Saccharibacteria bacterium]|nr:hypothetical protein [Candidatus Saccharibacteria bacterium]